jgi:hypothetical protein
MQLWLDNRDTLSHLSNMINSTFAYYSSLAIKALGRQSLSMSRWNAVSLSPKISDEISFNENLYKGDRIQYFKRFL